MKRIKALIFFAFFITVALSFAVLSSADTNTPILYRNDTKYTIDEFPPEIIDGTVYVPISFFVGLKNIQYEYGTSPIGFYLRNKNTKRYFSFSYNSTLIVVDGEIEEIYFPIVNSTVYIPLEYCADILSLKVEKISTSDSLKIRVSDGTQKMTFDELIELYNPTQAPDGPSVITPGKPNNAINTEHTDRTLYLVLTANKGYDITPTLNALKTYETKATVFFNKSYIITYPKSVIMTFVLGHSIGIYGDSIEEIEEANKALVTLLHLKTQLCMTDSNLTSDGLYNFYTANINASDYNKSARETARDIYNATFKSNTSTVNIAVDEKAEETIKQFLYYVSGDTYITAKTLG